MATAAAMTLACHRGAPVATSPSNSAIVSADQLLTAMHDRYAGKWYHNLVFVQQSSYLRDTVNKRVETWYEAGSMPGKLRIDLGNPTLGNGVLYRDDSVYTFQGGRVVDKRVGRNPLMVLGFDVYSQPVQKTFDALKDERIDLSVLRRDTLYGRPVYVVGAGPGQMTKNQFWIDAERMLFVRLVESDTAGRNTRDIRFEQYAPYAGGWVAEQVRVIAGGRDVFRENYSGVKVNVPLDSGMFVPEKWSSATHWYRP